MQIIRPNTNFQFISKQKHFILASVAVFIISVLLIGAFGLRYGIDFAGGTEIHVKLAVPTSADSVRETLGLVEFGGATVQHFGAVKENEYLIRVEKTTLITDEQAEALKAKAKEKFGADNLKRFDFLKESDKIDFKFNNDIELEALKALLGEAGIADAEVKLQGREGAREFLVAPMGVAYKIEEALKAKFGQENVEKRGVEFVGPKVGKELRNAGVLSVLYSLIGILIYIGLRFDFFFAPGAIIALFHDSVITLAIYTASGREFDLSTIAALLTIVGYSINDTIVVFDRIRENLVKYRVKPVEEIVNVSVNETLSRTLLTGLTTLFATIALWFFGGGIIRNFFFAMSIGIVIGTYSSIYIASPIFIYLRRKFGKPAP